MAKERTPQKNSFGQNTAYDRNMYNPVIHICHIVVFVYVYVRTHLDFSQLVQNYVCSVNGKHILK